MNDGDFQKFCYDEYKRSASSVDEIYKRYPFAVTVLIVVTGGVVAVGSDQHWQGFFVRVDATLYYTAIIIALGAVAISASLLIWSILPKNYQELSSLSEFLAWRAKYRDGLKSSGTYADEQIEAAVATHSNRAIMERLAQATDWNRATAKQRMRLYNRSVYVLSVAVVALAVAAAMMWIIKFRGA